MAAIESGYMAKQISRSAYERQRAIANCDELVVGVNCFTGENELEVETTRLVPHPYDPTRRDSAEEKQIADLKKLKKSRDNKEVKRLLNELENQAQDEKQNLFPIMIDCAKAYVTIQEACDVLRGVFGEYESPNIL